MSSGKTYNTTTTNETEAVIKNIKLGDEYRVVITKIHPTFMTENVGIFHYQTCKILVYKVNNALNGITHCNFFPDLIIHYLQNKTSFSIIEVSYFNPFSFVHHYLLLFDRY